jgi:hypothetical protein
MEFSMEFHGIPQKILWKIPFMEFHGIQWMNSMEFHGIFHEIPWKIPWNLIPWNFMNSRNFMEFGFDRVFSLFAGQMAVAFL